MLNFFKHRLLGELICGALILTLLFSGFSKANSATISDGFDSDANSYPTSEVQSSFNAEELFKSVYQLPISN